MVLENYKCAEPDDNFEAYKHIEKRALTVQKLRELLVSKISDNKDHIAQDLPLALLDFFEQSIFSKLMHAKGF